MARNQVHQTTNREEKHTLALVLAGGRGTRLQGLTAWRVKPAVPFGGTFRIIDFPLSNCINSGIRKIGVLTQYKSQSLIRHIVTGWGLLHPELGEYIEILPAQQQIAEEWYRGTADAVYQNIDTIRQHNPHHVLVLAGDHIYKMDYGPMIGFHRNTGAKLTIGCMETPLEEASRFGVVGVADDRQIHRFDEKPEQPTPLPDMADRALVSMGIYVFDTDFLCDQLIADAEAPSSSHDFGLDIIPSLIHRSKVMAYPFPCDASNGYWRDVGTVDSYWQANMELIGLTPALNLYDGEWPIRTTLRQHPSAKFVLNEEGRRGTAVNSMVAPGCVVSGAHVEDSLLFTNARIEEHSHVSESVVLPNVVVEPDCRLQKVVVDKDCIVPAGSRIGLDHEQDRRKFHVSPEGVVLVTPDMLGQSTHQIR